MESNLNHKHQEILSTSISRGEEKYEYLCLPSQAMCMPNTSSIRLVRILANKQPNEFTPNINVISGLWLKSAGLDINSNQ